MEHCQSSSDERRPRNAWQIHVSRLVILILIPSIDTRIPNGKWRMRVFLPHQLLHFPELSSCNKSHLISDLPSFISFHLQLITPSWPLPSPLLFTSSPLSSSIFLYQLTILFPLTPVYFVPSLLQSLSLSLSHVPSPLFPIDLPWRERKRDQSCGSVQPPCYPSKRRGKKQSPLPSPSPSMKNTEKLP